MNSVQLLSWHAMMVSTPTATQVVRNASITASMSKYDVIMPTCKKGSALSELACALLYIAAMCCNQQITHKKGLKQSEDSKQDHINWPSAGFMDAGGDHAT